MVKKVIYGDTVLLDLTQDTVTEEHLESGYTAHDANGNPIIGTLTGGGGAEVSKLTFSPIAQRCTKIACISYKEDGSTFIIGGPNQGIHHAGGIAASKFIISPIAHECENLTCIAYAEINNGFGGKTLIIGGTNGV